jgi:hypothetical protein
MGAGIDPLLVALRVAIHAVVPVAVRVWADAPLPVHLTIRRCRVHYPSQFPIDESLRAVDGVNLAGRRLRHIALAMPTSATCRRELLLLLHFRVRSRGRLPYRSVRRPNRWANHGAPSNNLKTGVSRITATFPHRKCEISYTQMLACLPFSACCFAPHARPRTRPATAGNPRTLPPPSVVL